MDCESFHSPPSLTWSRCMCLHPLLGLCGHYSACEGIVGSVNTGIFQFYFTFMRP